MSKLHQASWAKQIEYLVSQQHFDGARELVDAELAARPSSVDAQRWRVMLALTLDREEPGQTVAWAERLLAHTPAVALHHWLLGRARKNAGDMQGAIACYLRSLAIDGRQQKVWLSLGIAYRAQGKIDEAIRCYRRALRLIPDFAEAHANLGNALAERDRLADPMATSPVSEESVAAHRRALELAPDNASLYANLAIGLEHSGEIDEAIERYNEALGLDPERQDWLLRLGGCLMKLKRAGHAVAAYERWMEQHPESGVIASHLSLALLETNDLDRALEWAEKSLELDDQFGGAHLSRASTLIKMCEPAEAVESYRRALDLSPSHSATALSGLLMAMNYVEEYAAPILKAHQRFGALYPPSAVRRRRAESAADGRLRIGYLSGDFKQHSVAWFFESILGQHDRARFHVFCYHNSLVCDAVTERLMSHSEEWVECAKMTDAMLSDRIRADEIDILIDLSGHTAGHRLTVLAAQPAPVQMTYLGYPTTTGLSAIDYRITDAVIDPLDAPNMNAEEPLRCADSMFCYRPDVAPDLLPPPVMQSGSITFGSFNNGVKLSAHTLALWARVLAEVPGSQLFIKTQGFSHESVRERVRARMRLAGIDDSRVRFSGWRADKASHLELYREVDIALDTFPYNGATTTCEALWMGVPVLSLKGHTHVSRMGASILSAAGLSHWVASSEDEFLRIASRLANDPDAIAGFRAGARERLLMTALMDGRRFTRNFESLLASAWSQKDETVAAV